MLAVVASQADDVRNTLIPHFRNAEVRILTPLDLLQGGWRIDSDDLASSTAVVGGETVPLCDIKAVLCLLPAVLPEELWPIDAAARGYVAQETTAFLRYFLSVLRCPVLNPPSAGCLSGPHWRLEHWMRMAENAGLRVDPLCRSTRAPNHAERDSLRVEAGLHQVTVIGARLLELEYAHLLEEARTAAGLADLQLAAVTFRVQSAGRPVFCGANAFPRLSGPRAAQLLEEYFDGQGG